MTASYWTPPWLRPLVGFPLPFAGRAEPSRAALPTGVGMFCGHLRANMPDVAERAGLSWICAEVRWQSADPKHRAKPNRKSTHAMIADELRARGIAVHAWAWLLPRTGKEGWRAGLKDSVAAASALGAESLVLDSEGPWYGRASACGRLMRAASKQCHAAGLSLGVTSLGLPSWHPSLPWSEFGLADYGIPQAYDSKNHLGPDYPARCVEEWHERTGLDHLACGFATYGKTREQFHSHMMAIPPVPAAIGWLWRHTSEREWAEIARWAAERREGGWL